MTWIKRTPIPVYLKLLACWFMSGVGFGTLHGIQIDDYSAAAHDRFASGYPINPEPNQNPAFIGLPFNWSGVGWNPAGATKSFGFISPQHYVVARHFGGSTEVAALNDAGGLVSGEQRTITNTTYGLIFAGQSVGDLSVGILREPISQLARYPVLDLNASSTANTPANYNGRSILVYGRGPNSSTSTRIAAGSVTRVTSNGLNQNFTTSRTLFQLESGDSGSPAFVEWINPNGMAELALLGNNAGIGDFSNFHNFMGSVEVMNALNAILVLDGRALRIVGEPFATWSGASSSWLSRNSAWGISGGNPNASGATADEYVAFDAAVAATRTVAVDTAYNLRGLYFLSTAVPGDPFAIQGTASLTIGRGGITNYDADAHVFIAPLRLGNHQLWDGGNGGLSIGDLDTNGKLLELRSTGTIELAGTISGSGAIALDSGLLSITGNPAHAGATWIQGGDLRLAADMRSSELVTIQPNGRFSGTGMAGRVINRGTIIPGSEDQAGIMVIDDLVAESGSRFVFQFSQLNEPNFSMPQASGNALLRLTSPTPFPTPLDSSHAISVLLDTAPVFAGQRLRGGFFTDRPEDFSPSVIGAAFVYYVPDAAGSHVFGNKLYSEYSGPFAFKVGAVPCEANLSGNVVSGRCMQITVLGNGHQITFEEWQAIFLGQQVEDSHAAPAGADSDLLLAYALGLDPRDPTQLAKPHVLNEVTGQQAVVRLQYRRYLLAGDITSRVLQSADMLNWQAVTVDSNVLIPDLFHDQTVELREVVVPVNPSAPVFLQLEVVR